MSKNLPINLPSRVRGDGKQAITAEWANSIREAIARLANRLESRRPNTTGWNLHPWKVTANGDDTVTVAAGDVLEFVPLGSSGSPYTPMTSQTSGGAFTGGTVTVTGDGGIYAVITVTQNPWADSQVVQPDGTVTFNDYLLGVESVSVAFDPTLSGSQIGWLIAIVELNDGIASVTNQVVRDTIPLQIGFGQLV